MKKAKTITLFSLFIFSVILTTNVLCHAQQYVLVIAIKANLRASPDAQSKIVAAVKMGDKLQLIKQSGAWFFVQSSNNVGWLHGNTIDLIKDDEVLSNPKAVNINPNYLSSENDKGYDIVKIQKSVSLYSRPNQSVITSLSTGAVIVLLSRGHSEGWLNVIDVQSGKEGWIYYKNTQVYFTQKTKSSESVFEARQTDSDKVPDIIIKNDTNRLLTFRLGEEVYEISSYSSRSITVSGGTYKFYASVPGAYPLLGSEDFSMGYEYTWTFFISRG